VSATYIDFTHRAVIADEPEAWLNQHALKEGRPFTKVDLGVIEVTVHDLEHAERIAAVFTEAARIQREALAALTDGEAQS
jgi:hypothetical protein